MGNILGVEAVSHDPGDVHLPSPKVIGGYIEHIWPNSGFEEFLIHMEQTGEIEILFPSHDFIVHRQSLCHPGLVSGTGVLTTVAAINPHPHGLAHMHWGNSLSVVTEIRDALSGVDPVGAV